MAPVLSTISQVADTKCTVLITGESGTGKELVAKSLVVRLPARAQALRGGQLRRHPRHPGRIRAVRPRQGLVHRRLGHPHGPLRPGRRRDHLPRRDRGDGAERPGQAAAPDPGRRVLSHRRDQPDQGGRAHPGGHQPQAGGRGRGQPLPGRPVLAAERHPHRAAAPAPSAVGHPAADRALRPPGQRPPPAAGERRRTARRCWRSRATPGPATSASWRTSSSVWSS